MVPTAPVLGELLDAARVAESLITTLASTSSLICSALLRWHQQLAALLLFLYADRLPNEASSQEQYILSSR